jgi:hypothetical protein
MAHLVGGVILMALGLWGVIAWWETFGLVMQAVVPLAMIVAGSLSILSSYYRMGHATADDEGPGEERDATR